MKTFMQYLVENNNAVDKIIEDIAYYGGWLIPFDEEMATNVIWDWLADRGGQMIELQKIDPAIYGFTYKSYNLDKQTN